MSKRRVNGLMGRLGAAVIAVALAAATLLMPAEALADKLHLKDGRVLEGEVIREGDGFVFFRIKVGTVTSEQLFTKDQISKIERDAGDAPKTDAPSQDSPAGDDAKKEEKKDDGPLSASGATRVAIINFGPPSSWQGSAGDMVGVQVSAEGFRRVIPLLEKAKTDVVVIRINSGGGYALEVPKFHEIFEKEYKPRFRTVAWVESAISAAAMGPWVIEEFYFMPEGNIGACTAFSGRLNATKGAQLEIYLTMMERASRLGKRDEKIMRAMQIQEPLSVDVDENGNVIWRQDEDGQFVLNKRDEVYTMNANDALRFRFAKGIASTKEELAKAMGLQEVEWVAPEATAFMDKNIRDNDTVEKRNQETLQKYMLAIQLAEQLQDRQQRGGQLAIARRLLAELRRNVQVNPNFVFHLGIPEEWFEEQEARIKRLSQQP